MGVLACDRKNCTSIMCDRLSHEHGYICRDCFEELVRTNPDDVEEFMNTSPNGPDTPEWVVLKFETEFPIT